jgi:hypothetical protein
MEADCIFRVAFGTFLGLPNPIEFFGDADNVRTRWAADPSAAWRIDTSSVASMSPYFIL